MYETYSDLHHIGDEFTLPDGSVTTIDILLHDGSFYGKTPGELAREFGGEFVHFDSQTGEFKLFNSEHICFNPESGRCELNITKS